MTGKQPSSSGLSSVPGQGLAEDEVELGYVSGVFGVKGEVRLHLHNREDSSLLEGVMPVVLVDDAGGRHAARCRARPGAGKRVLADLGLVGREEARAVMGWTLAIRQSDLPELADDGFYVWQLVGLPVYVDGEARGEVVTVHDTDQVDVLEIQIDGESAFVPLLHEWVTLDLEGGRVDVKAEALD